MATSASRAVAERRPLRVCMLSEGFYPEVLGGLEINGYLLADKLIGLGFDCEVLARPLRRETPRRQKVGRVAVNHLGVAGQFKGAGLRAAAPLARFVLRYGAWLVKERRRFDLVLALGAKTTALPAVLADLLGGPPFVVASLAGGEFLHPISEASLARGGRLLGGLLGPWQRLRRLGLRRAAAVVAVSEEVARGFRALGVPAERIARIPTGYDDARFRPVPPAERAALRAGLGLPRDKDLFVYVGRLSRAKGLVMLAEVWPEVVARHPAAHLVLVGSGDGSPDDCEAELEALVAGRGLGAAVTFAGATGDVPAYLQAADLFVLPSEHEGLSTALIEAMACGLPVIATAVGGAPELVDDPAHGRLVPAKDPAALRAAVGELYARRAAWPAMGAAAHATAAAGYGIDAVAARYAALLRRAAPGRYRPDRLGTDGPPSKHRGAV